MSFCSCVSVIAYPETAHILHMVKSFDRTIWIFNFDCETLSHRTLTSIHPRLACSILLMPAEMRISASGWLQRFDREPGVVWRIAFAQPVPLRVKHVRCRPPYFGRQPSLQSIEQLACSCSQRTSAELPMLSLG